MSSFVIDLLRRVFPSEEAGLVAWLQKRKFLVVTLLAIVVIMALYLRYPGLFQAARNVLVDPTPFWISAVLLVWLLVLTCYLYGTRKSTERREFLEDFRHGLEEWEYYGGWRTERVGNHYMLIVTESGNGGIARPCRLWTDYSFEFETKIVKHNTSWIIRARDIFNCVMLQCQPTSLNPHFRVDGEWIKLDPIPLPQQLPVNTWFDVRITVTGTRVIATVRVDGTEREILNDRLLEPGNVPVTVSGDPSQKKNIFASYPMGSVGFRESSKRECAHFQNVRVTRFG
jgi:hypothetical protein